eukprot:5538894-Prymnesium_polylepis.1
MLPAQPQDQQHRLQERQAGARGRPAPGPSSVGARQRGAGGAARSERQGRPRRPPWSPIRQH